MPTDHNVELHIPAHMNLEQAMEEVRKYLETTKRRASLPPAEAEMGSNLALQAAFNARLSEIATRFGHVEPNSKLGPLGVYLKRLMRKLIGWYSRPIHDFNRTALENLQQIRHDMLRMQQQIAAAGERSGIGESNLDERSNAAVLTALLAVPAVRQALQDGNPALLQRVEELLKAAERPTGSDTAVPGANART